MWLSETKDTRKKTMRWDHTIDARTCKPAARSGKRLASSPVSRANTNNLGRKASTLRIYVESACSKNPKQVSSSPKSLGLGHLLRDTKAARAYVPQRSRSEAAVPWRTCHQRCHSAGQGETKQKKLQERQLIVNWDREERKSWLSVLRRRQYLLRVQVLNLMIQEVNKSEAT